MPVGNFAGGVGPGLDAPRVTSWNTVASYATYGEAHAAVDRLASWLARLDDEE
jgi:hypothetical protein